MNIAEAIESKLVKLGSAMTDKDMVACFNEYKDNLRQAIMAEDQSNFIMVYDDGSCIRITVASDHTKVEVGEDMEFVPTGSKLSS